MAGSILKGISVIKSVSPKVKNKSVSRSKGRIAKHIGQMKKIDDEREEIMEINLKRAEEGKGSIYGTVEETKEEIKKLNKEKVKFPSKKMREMDEGLEFETTSEYAKGGLVKKGLPKLAKRGWK